MSALHRGKRKDKPTARFKTRGDNNLVLLLLAVILQMVTVQSQVCGGQSWLQAWNDSYDVTYQVAAISESLDSFQVGGRANQPSQFTSSTEKNMFDPSHSAAALVLFFESGQENPTWGTILSYWSLQNVKIVGVRALSLVRSDRKTRGFVVFETDQDSSRLILGHFSPTGGILARLSLANVENVIVQSERFTTFNSCWLLGNYKDGGINRVFTIKTYPGILGTSSTHVLPLDNISKSVAPDKQYLRSFDITASYMYRLTEATCKTSSGSTYEGFLVTVTSSASSTDPINIISNALCLDAASSTVSNIFGVGKAYQGVQIAGNSQALYAVILLKETILKTSFLTGNIYFTAKKIPTLSKFQFTDSAAFEILSVEKRQPSGQIQLALILRQTVSNKVWLVHGLVAALSQIVAVYQTSFSLFASASIPSAWSSTTSDAIGFRSISDSEVAYFGAQRVERYPSVQPNTEASQCKRINLVESAASLQIPAKIIDVSLDDQIAHVSETLITSTLSSQSEQWMTSTHITLTLSADFWVTTNKCGFPVGDLFLARSKNLLNQAAATISSNLNTGWCPDGTTKIIPNSALDVSYELVDFTFLGTISTDFSAFLRMQANSVVGELLPYKGQGQGYTAGQYTVKYRVGFAVSTTLEKSKWPPIEVVFTLVKTCDIVTPTVSTASTFRDGYTYLRGSPGPVKLTFSSAVNDDCVIQQTLTFADGTALAPTSVYNFAFPYLLLQSDSPTYEGSKDLKYRVESALAPAGFFKEITFTVSILMSSCTKIWRTPTSPSHFDTTYKLQEPLLEVVFTDVSLNDCPFQLSLWNATAVPAKSLDVPYIKLKQAVQLADPSDPMRVSVSKFGSFQIQTDDAAHISNSKLELRIISQRYPGDTEYRALNLNLSIKPCVSVQENTEKVVGGFNYTVGDPRLVLGTVGVLNPLCENSFFSIAPDLLLLPSGLLANNATAIRQVILSLHAETLLEAAAGNYSITVAEQDFNTGFAAKTTFQISVYTRNNSKVFNVTEPIAPSVVVPAKPDFHTQVNHTAETPVVAEVPAIVIEWDENGLPVYPWQKTAARQKQRNQTISATEKIQPLLASVLSLSSTGQLIIAFSKPIFKPPIRTTSHERRLDDAFQYELDEIVEVDLESDFYEPGSPELRILNYTLTNMTQTQMHIQVNFEQPGKLAFSPLQPDFIIVRILKPELFMDAVDMMRLDAKLDMLHEVQPQVSEAIFAELEAVGQTVESSLTNFSIGLCVGQIFVTIGLKYLWNIMNLLQFLIFMQQLWRIRLPPTTSVILKQLQAMALMEFIPTQWFKDSVRRWFGLEKPCEGDCLSDAEATGEQSLEERSSPDLLDNLGAMVFIGCLVVGILLLFVLFWLAARKCACCQRLIQIAKQKLLYNSLLRYVLQSTLKLQIGAFSVIFFSELAQADAKVKVVSQAQIVISWIIFAVLNVCPFLFLLILWRNQDNLDAQAVKAKIGSLYTGFNARRASVKTYCFVFLLRRTFFVLLTFLLISQPNIQVNLMIVATLAYVGYLSNADFFESLQQRWLEVFNEAVFCTLMYNFVLLNNIVFEDEVRQLLGNLIIGQTGLLLLVNLVVILVVSIKAIARQCYLRKLKAKYVLRYKEEQRLEAMRQLELEIQQAEQGAPSSSNGSSSSEASSRSHSSVVSYSDPQQQALRAEMLEKYGLQPIGTGILSESGHLNNTALPAVTKTNMLGYKRDRLPSQKTPIGLRLSSDTRLQNTGLTAYRKEVVNYDDFTASLPSHNQMRLLSSITLNTDSRQDGADSSLIELKTKPLTSQSLFAQFVSSSSVAVAAAPRPDPIQQTIKDLEQFSKQLLNQHRSPEDEVTDL